MKNIFKINLGSLAVAVVLATLAGFSMAACGDGSGGDAHPFIGTWAGDGFTIEITNNTSWTATTPGGTNWSGTYTSDGNSANFIQTGGGIFGTATVSGNTMTVYQEGTTFYLTKGGASGGGGGTDVNWTAVADSKFGTNWINGIAWGGNKFVAGGHGGKMAYSFDGITWTAVADSKFDTIISGIAWGSNGSTVNRFVAVGQWGKIAYSSDGESWTAVANSTFGTDWINGIAWGSNGSTVNRFVAVGDYGKIAYSTDGISWTAVVDSKFGDSDIISIAWGGGAVNKFVAVGSDGKMASSSDGISWTAVMNSTFGTSFINDIAWGSDKFVAVGRDGKMAYSTNGESWTTLTDSKFGTNYIQSIAWGTDKFVAGGQGGKAAYSSDGLSWTAVTDSKFGANVIYDIAWGANKFVAVGDNGRITVFVGTLIDFSGYTGAVPYSLSSDMPPSVTQGLYSYNGIIANGMRISHRGDSSTTVINRYGGGIAVKTNRETDYLYFFVDNAGIKKADTITMKLTYFDNVSRAMRLHYVSKTNPYQEIFIPRHNTQTYVTVTVQLDNCGFGARYQQQNQDAQFRFVCYDGDGPVIQSLELIDSSMPDLLTDIFTAETHAEGVKLSIDLARIPAGTNTLYFTTDPDSVRYWTNDFSGQGKMEIIYPFVQNGKSYTFRVDYERTGAFGQATAKAGNGLGELNITNAANIALNYSSGTKTLSFTATPTVSAIGNNANVEYKYWEWAYYKGNNWNNAEWISGLLYETPITSVVFNDTFDQSLGNRLSNANVFVNVTYHVVYRGVNFYRDVATSPSFRFPDFNVVVEEVSLSGGMYAIYRFDLPANTTWGDYAALSVDYKIDDAAMLTTAGSSRAMRLMGPYVGDNTFSFFGLTNGSGKRQAVQDYGNGKNAPFIIDQLSGDQNGNIQAVAAAQGVSVTAGQWFTLPYKIDGSRAHTDFIRSNIPASTATGPFYFGVGWTGNDGSGITVVQQIKNVTLIGKSGTTNLIATLVIFEDQESNLYPAYTGYVRPEGGDGAKEAERRIINGTVDTIRVTLSNIPEAPVFETCNCGGNQNICTCTDCHCPLCVIKGVPTGPYTVTQTNPLTAIVDTIGSTITFDGKIWSAMGSGTWNSANGGSTSYDTRVNYQFPNAVLNYLYDTVTISYEVSPYTAGVGNVPGDFTVYVNNGYGSWGSIIGTTEERYPTIGDGTKVETGTLTYPLSKFTGDGFTLQAGTHDHADGWLLRITKIEFTAASYGP